MIDNKGRDVISTATEHHLPLSLGERGYVALNAALSSLHMRGPLLLLSGYSCTLAWPGHLNYNFAASLIRCE